MVAKISHGMNLYGALAYNHDKVAAGTAEILSGNRMISDRLGLPSEDIRLALLSFENYLLANRNTEKPVLHISLSPAPEDRLSHTQLEELAARYMEKMGYGNQPYIVYKHADTHNAHIHIVSVCVDGQGKKISDAYEHRRSMTACRELETDFGLRNGADTERRNPKAELRKVDASLGDVRHQVGNTLKAVLESYRVQTFGEYNALLSTLNIEAKQVRGEYNGTPYTGIVYSATDDTGKVGFRCGFLGLLHLEIIQERLEREYNLDLVTTAPSVIYKVYKTNGEVIELTNPTNLPDPSEIEYMEEPMVKAEIMVTTEFIGAIMDLCQERRGQYEGMEYMEETRALLKYRLPLNEIIYDFFDALKSRSRGYASLDYELDGYERSELVKLDILVNKEEVDALSFIVHADTAYERGRKMCEKLKDEIPRQLFEIPIQAAIGSKVIARETVRAMRKDVLAKCYGGDISRKKKLLEKQKEGKKRMRQVGNVEIPQKAFMSVLKLDDK